VFDCFLDFESGVIPFYVWLESGPHVVPSRPPARDRSTERERSGSVPSRPVVFLEPNGSES
jgi:hypothetical protein